MPARRISHLCVVATAIALKSHSCGQGTRQTTPHRLLSRHPLMPRVAQLLPDWVCREIRARQRTG